MQSVLILGDSNTWGQDPDTGDRFPVEKRWPTLVHNYGYSVIPIGVPGLAFNRAPSRAPWYTTHNFLRRMIIAHSEVDIVLVAVGTNNLEADFLPYKIVEEMIADFKVGLNEAKSTARTFGIKLVMTIPPHRTHSRFPYETIVEKLKKLFKDSSVDYIDYSDIRIDSVDGVHFTEKHHKQIAEKTAKALKEL